MDGDMLIRLSPGAVARLRGLMERFGEDDEAAMISRSLGLLEALENHLASDGTLTVVNQKARKIDKHIVDVDGATLADLVFEKRRVDA